MFHAVVDQRRENGELWPTVKVNSALLKRSASPVPPSVTGKANGDAASGVVETRCAATTPLHSPSGLELLARRADEVAGE
jgi:hypothetical protein